MSAPPSAPPGASLQPNLPAGWKLEWSAQYHTTYYLNVHTGASTWTVPMEPALDVVKPSQHYSTEAVEVLPQQQLSIQPTPGGYLPSPSPVSAISSQGRYFQPQSQNVAYAQQGAVPALFFLPPPDSSQSQTTTLQQTSVQQFPPPPSSSHSQVMPLSQHTPVEHFPPPPDSNQKDGQVLQPQQNNSLQYFPPPPPLPPRSSTRPQFSFPPPPLHPDSNARPQTDVQVQNKQPTLDLHLQTRPTPLTSKPRPRSFIGQMEMMKMQVSEQSHIYGAKVMETKLGTKVGKLIPNTKTGSKETDPLLDTNASPQTKGKEEKKLWDDRTEEEKKESYKKWGKRAAIGAGVVAAVVIGAEAIEHVANASDALGSVGNGLGSANDAMNSAASAVSVNAASNASMMALASAEANSAALSAGFAAMSSALI